MTSSALSASAESMDSSTPVWSASFVAPSGTEAPTAGGAASMFRYTFEARIPRSAVLYTTGLGVYESYLNGHQVSDEVLAPGWTSYRYRLAVRRIDVTHLIRDGRNCLAMLLGEGWARGPLGYGQSERDLYADRGAVFAQLELTYVDGSTVLIGSDAEWRTSCAGPIIANGLYSGEQYDARLEDLKWAEPIDNAEDDSRWTPVELLPWDLKTLFVTDAPPVRRLGRLAPVDVLTTPSGAVVVDFGQNIAGWVEMTVSGPAGSAVTLRHAEVLENGELCTRPLRQAEATDRYTLRGSEQDVPEVWQPRFTFHGFRYLEVGGWPNDAPPLTRETVQGAFAGVVIGSDMRRTGTFACSDPLVQRLHDNVVWSMVGNFISLPTDCPQRDERLGWTGDINIFAPTAAYLYDVRSVLRSWLADVRVEYDEVGVVPVYVPSIGRSQKAVTAVWSDVIVHLPWNLYQAYGDVSILAENFLHMRRLVDDVTSRLSDSGLWDTGFQFGDWLDPAAPPENPSAGRTEAAFVATAYFAHTARIASCAATALGEQEDAARFQALGDRVISALRQEWVAPSGRLVIESQTAYALVLVLDLLENDVQRVRAGQRLAALVAQEEYRIATGFVGTPYVLEALTVSGHSDIAFRMLHETSCPSFLYPVTMGATTTWERWDSMLPDGSINSGEMTSFNHYALGAVAAWLHQRVAGIRALEPGYSRLEIAPLAGGDLTYASGELETPFGPVAARWSIDDSTMKVDVQIPEGVKANVVLPLHPQADVKEVASGSHQWSYEVVRKQPTRYDRATTIGVLMEDSNAWGSVVDALQVLAPQLPIAEVAPQFRASTLNEVLGLLGVDGDGGLDEVLATLNELKR